MVPTKQFVSKRKICNLFEENSCVGSDPWKQFPANRNSNNLFRAPMNVGMDPKSLLFDTLKSRRGPAKLAKVVGNVPVKLLSSRYKWVSFPSEPIAVVMLPTNLLFDRLHDKTTEHELKKERKRERNAILLKLQ